jgi:ribonuclease-3
VVSEAGPAHDRRFEVAALVNSDVLGKGTGRSKKAAEQEAAQVAMDRLNDR